MLDLSAVDLGALATALEDHSDFTRWFVDPTSGEVIPWSDEMEYQEDPEDRGAVFVDPLPSHEAYGDMTDFVNLVSDRRAAGLLGRAIEGRGAFRRFKDTLFEFPELREAWFRFHDVRMRRRAVGWLVDAGLVDQPAASRLLESLEEPVVGRGLTDGTETAEAVARSLRNLFGDRLVDVVMFGSHATGTATDDSDLDLAVVLRDGDADSVWHDARSMDSVLWDATRGSGITVSAVIVGPGDWDNPTRPMVRTARAQGRSVL